MDITLENYEFAFFQYEEGLLTPEERQQVEAFCRQHPELGEELQLAMECPKLQPLSLEAPKERRAIIVPLWAKRALSAAACVGLLIGIGVQLWQPAPAPEAAPQTRLVAENHHSPNGATHNSPGCGNPNGVTKPWVGNAPTNRRPVGVQDQAASNVAPLQGASVDESSNPGFNRPDGAQSPWAIISDPVGVPASHVEPEMLYAEGFIQQVDSEEFQILLAQNYIEASEILALSADEPAPKSEEELSHPISTWLARQKEAALMQLAEFFTQKFNH